ncbi:MAG: histone family protein [Candidatus Aenigmarchaeota archaeon]|nr:histone family protein [Candidatus Aenigmarchaeota archaeon]OYT58286.1 MAG: histone [Candidatus Aenigmarchaeota archaeon ex4484_14]
MTLPIFPFGLIAKKAGAKRVSADAIEELRDTVEEIGLDIARKAVLISQHSGRRTVQKKDIEFVIKHKMV